MSQHTPNQPEHDDHDDEDLVFPTPGQLPPVGPPEQGEHPDLIWHRPQPQRRLRAAVPDRYGRLSDTTLGLAALGALAAVVILALAVGPYVLAAVHWLLDPANVADPATQLWHTVNDPILSCLAERGAGLPAGPGTLYAAWAATGLLILWRALRQGAIVGVQLGALVWGALTAALVWDGTPGPGRPVAAGLAVLLWAGLAALALTGSWTTAHTTVINEVKPTVPEPTPVTVEVTVPEPRIEGVVVDIQRLVVDSDGHRISPTDDQS